MAQTKTAKLKKLQRQVNEKLKNLVIPGGEDRKEYIAKILAPLPILAIGATSTESSIRDRQHWLRFRLAHVGL
jgi:hypothetical protein